MIYRHIGSIYIFFILIRSHHLILTEFFDDLVPSLPIFSCTASYTCLYIMHCGALIKNSTLVDGKTTSTENTFVGNCVDAQRLRRATYNGYHLLFSHTFGYSIILVDFAGMSLFSGPVCRVLGDHYSCRQPLDKSYSLLVLT